MTTITINNSIIENKYTGYEIKMEFLNFLQKKEKSNDVNLYEISIDDLGKKSKDRLENIDTLNFINY